MKVYIFLMLKYILWFLKLCIYSKDRVHCIKTNNDDKHYFFSFNVSFFSTPVCGCNIPQCSTLLIHYVDVDNYILIDIITLIYKITSTIILLYLYLINISCAQTYIYVVRTIIWQCVANGHRGVMFGARRCVHTLCLVNKHY